MLEGSGSLHLLPTKWHKPQMNSPTIHETSFRLLDSLELAIFSLKKHYGNLQAHLVEERIVVYANI